MSLLILFGSDHAVLPDPTGTGSQGPFGNLRAMLDAVMKEDDRIGGRGVTRLSQVLTIDHTVGMFVDSTIGFGEDTDGNNDALLLVGSELVAASSRTSQAPFCFTALTRGVSNTIAQLHPATTLVIDLSRNTSMIDRLRRAFLVEFALLEDLEVIARNLGLERCPGTNQEQLRRIIKAVAYLPKQTVNAFTAALEALTGGVLGTDFSIIERIASDPWKVFVEIAIAISTDIRGRMLLNSGEPQLTTGAMTVDVDFDIILSTLAAYPGFASQIIEGRNYDYPSALAGSLQFAVYDDTTLARRGIRQGLTNYATGGSVLGKTITLGSSPGGAGTPVLVDYTAFIAHYVPANETVRQPLANDDHWAYLADPLLAARCLLDQIRAAGVRVELSTQL